MKDLLSAADMKKLQCKVPADRSGAIMRCAARGALAALVLGAGWVIHRGQNWQVAWATDWLLAAAVTGVLAVMVMLATVLLTGAVRWLRLALNASAGVEWNSSHLALRFPPFDTRKWAATELAAEAIDVDFDDDAEWLELANPTLTAGSTRENVWAAIMAYCHPRDASALRRLFEAVSQATAYGDGAAGPVAAGGDAAALTGDR